MGYLQRLLGEWPDPRPLFFPPHHFARSLQLPAEVTTTESLRFAIRRLLLELDGFLRRRQLGARELAWSFLHGAGKKSLLRLGLALPERDSGRLQMLLRERLERFVLPAPVQEIGLRVTHLEPLAGRPLDLFEARAGHVGAPLLIERLRARLGETAVGAIEVVAEHRPERAWRRTSVAAATVGGGRIEAARLPMGPRPLWLLPQPEPLADRAGWPWWRGRLQLEGERERIESGWWDGGAIARDYFVATAPAGERLWIYREIGAGRRWYLHGFF
jgi:protein ImuB